MRVTLHNSRGCKNSSKGYNQKHNDRKFDLEKADNIDHQKSINNRYWSYGQGWKTDKNAAYYKSFEQVENDYYDQHFRGQYDATVAKYIKQRHRDKIVAWDEWKQDKKFCPEESCVQIGNIDEHATSEQLTKVALDYLASEINFGKEHNNCFIVLDAALHFDEAVPHLQVRKVWRSVQNGIETIGQNKALESAGLELPEPGKKINGNNNYKITYSKIMREKLLDICEAYGLKVEREPEQNVKHNRSKKHLIADKKRANELIEQKNDELHQENERLKSEKNDLEKQIKNVYEQLDSLSDNEILIRAECIKRKRQSQSIKQVERIEKAGQIIERTPGKRRVGKISPAEHQDNSL